VLAPFSAKLLTRKNKQPRREGEFDDEARFLRSWFERPLTTGAVAPSGRALAQRMAAAVEPASIGPVIELGPGTGPVTQALLDHGIAEERLVLVEYSADFCKLLGQRFPKATVIQGDAYSMSRTLKGVVSEPAAAVVSSLPLLTKPESQRLRLLADAFSMMVASGPFIQFTYMRPSPVPLVGGFEASVSGRIWKNLPPARVWTYRRVTG